MLAHHVASGAAVTVAATRRDVNISLGVMEFDDPAAPERLTHYVEKPTLSYEVSMGVYCFAPRVLAAHRAQLRLDFPDLILRLLAPASASRLAADAYWLDLGRHDDYELALRSSTRAPPLIPEAGAGQP